jgi:hypothetical protein
MLLSENDLQVLAAQGWLYLTNLSGLNIVAVGEQLGKPTSSQPTRDLTDVLLPLNCADAPPGSLSSIYGLGEIPFHTDGVYHPIPPKYMILQARTNVPFALRILDFQQLDFSPQELATLSHDVWIVNGYLKKFYGAILSNSLVRDKTVIRYNQMGMVPCDQNHTVAGKILASKLENADYFSLYFTANSILILNNWRMLHGRDKVTPEQRYQGKLERLFVME